METPAVLTVGVFFISIGRRQIGLKLFDEVKPVYSAQFHTFDCLL